MDILQDEDPERGLGETGSERAVGVGADVDGAGEEVALKVA